MTIEIQEAVTGRDRKRWVAFQYEHYRGDSAFVPQLISDELDTMDPEKNPAFEVADVKLLLAYEEGTCVGRICGIIHRREAEKLGWKRGRFGWFESVEDPAVAEALLDHLENWFRAEGTISAGIVEGFNNKLKLITRKSYGFRTQNAYEIALYHNLGALPQPESTHSFF